MSEENVFLKWNPEAINTCTPERRVELLNMIVGRIDYFYEKNKLLQSQLSEKEAEIVKLREELSNIMSAHDARVSNLEQKIILRDQRIKSLEDFFKDPKLNISWGEDEE